MKPPTGERIWTWSTRIAPCAGALIFLAIGWESLPPWHSPSRRALPIERGGAPLDRFAAREDEDATDTSSPEDRAATDAIRDRSNADERAVATRSGEADTVERSDRARASATGEMTPTIADGSATNYWLNLRSGVRHNRECRYFDPTGDGRFCGADEGRACRICGG